MRIAELIFWGSLGLAVYAYAVYPVLVALVAKWASRPARVERNRRSRDFAWPTVTLLIPTHCDEAAIVERLKNAAQTWYPPERLEILVGCGTEEDLTELLARSFHDPRVRVLSFPGHRGHAAILNACVPRAKGEIVVLTNVRAMLRRDAIRRLVRDFRDPSVGGVCGKLHLVDPATGRAIDSLDWKLENFVKRSEARLGALLGASGGIFAIRKKLFAPLTVGNEGEDFALAMHVRRQGFRVLYNDAAVATDENGTLAERDFERVVRRKAGGFEELGPGGLRIAPRYRPRTIVFWTHKMLRRLCPAFLIAAFVSNACLSGQPFYLRCLLIHELVYLVALAGMFLATRARRQRPADARRVPPRRSSVGDEQAPQPCGRAELPTGQRNVDLSAPAGLS